MQRLGEVITFFEENRKTQVKGHGAKALYRFTSEHEEIRMRLKLEINCKEHFNFKSSRIIFLKSPLGKSLFLWIGTVVIRPSGCFKR